VVDHSVDDYAFLTREQKTIVDENETISSIMDQNQSVTIDVINRNTITKVIFMYETNSYSIYVLKSAKISSLLNSENLLQQLNISATSFDDFILVFEGTNDQVLTKVDLQQPIGAYSITENQPICCRISMSVQITIYDRKEQITIPLANRNITIEQLLQLSGISIDVYKYLVSNDTTTILDYNENISSLNKTKFILLKENETCLVWIGEKCQRYPVFATLADIYRQNQIDISHQYLVYANDFVPSVDTQLTSFQTESPIRFIVIDDNLPVIVTIENKETEQRIKLNCLVSLTVKRLCAISCQLFGLRNECYQLMLDDSTLIDDEISLEEIDETMTEIRFQLTCTMSIDCSVRFSGQTVVLSCQHDTLASVIVKETLQKRYIPENDLDQYELIALNEDETEIDFEISIDDIRQLFSSPITTMPFELRKKGE
jgi:hypothetical protein